ncbi:hypothetical protein RUND412_005776 [Rhizina undulata]
MTTLPTTPELLQSLSHVRFLPLNTTRESPTMFSKLIIPRMSLLRRPLSSLRSGRIPGPRAQPIKAGRLGIPPHLRADAKSSRLPDDPETDQYNQYVTAGGSAGDVHNAMLTPVYIPEDADSVLHSRHPATRILDNSALVVQRKLELGNLLLGFEQANKYVIMDPAGNHVGFMAEQESGIGKMLARQWFRTHRSFTTHVFDKYENEVLRFHRPFSWINSRIRVYDPIDPRSFSDSNPAQDRLLYAEDESKFRIIGECQQQWHPFRRKYNLFLYNDPPEAVRGRGDEPEVGGRGGYFTQFAYIDEPFLSWDFSLLTEQNQLIGSVNRNFAGFGREIFTDTGVYVLRMDAASVAAEPRHLISSTAADKEYRPHSSTPVESQAGGEGFKEVVGLGDVAAGRGMTLDERAVMLAAAVTIDFDYFSRHSTVGGFIPFGVYGGGGEYRDDSLGGGLAGGVAGGMMGEAIGGAMGGGHPSGTQGVAPEQQVPPEQLGPLPGDAEGKIGEQSPFLEDGEIGDEDANWSYQQPPPPWGTGVGGQGDPGLGVPPETEDQGWWFFDDEE